MDIAIKLVVGLGNPGPKYERSRHNAGADFVEGLARKYDASLRVQDKFFGATARISIDGYDLRLLVPNTYMNLSGKAIGAMAGFYGITPDEILVVHDELDLPPGTSRLKRGGGHGGHNGLRDTIRALANSRDFARLRIGIGHPGNSRDVVDYVLRLAPQDEQILLQLSTDKALEVLPLAIMGRWDDAMTKLHTN